MSRIISAAVTRTGVNLASTKFLDETEKKEWMWETFFCMICCTAANYKTQSIQINEPKHYDFSFGTFCATKTALTCWGTDIEQAKTWFLLPWGIFVDSPTTEPKYAATVVALLLCGNYRVVVSHVLYGVLSMIETEKEQKTLGAMVLSVKHFQNSDSYL